MISRRVSGRRVSCRLATGPSVESLASSNLYRTCSGPRWISTGSETKVSAQRSIGRRPEQQHEDGVRLELADARRGVGQIAIESGAPFLDRGGGDHRRQETAADDVDAELPGLVAVDEGADIGAGADQKDALRRQ